MAVSLGRASVLSVLIPAYNERDSIAQVLVTVAAALPDVSKEIVVVDDGSTDGTREWLDRNIAKSAGYWQELTLEADGTLGRIAADRHSQGAVSFQVIFHDRNRGKGAALQTAMKASTGDAIVVQDADLEYDPADWERMYRLICVRQVADVVYGSRFYGYAHRSLYFHHYCANQLISLLFNLLYNQTLSDVEVCYKMFTREVLESLKITQNDFGFEIQISAQIARQRKWRIYELGIHYYGRTYSEGKKINWKDGVKALWYLFWFRFI
ncbi:glycosyltransferase family 2 protein [Synechococcus sp. PCC 7336]|uniref:glycosyltransferase family 2 protein n=1 Tax=Synechococcus sp. PCC 7336 TaxID=195250 RepID=UPI000346E13F|nr:glycosyltransferase family 2 protein [Synechococcus sp. PCC 7336]